MPPTNREPEVVQRGIIKELRGLRVAALADFARRFSKGPFQPPGEPFLDVVCMPLRGLVIRGLTIRVDELIQDFGPLLGTELVVLGAIEIHSVIGHKHVRIAPGNHDGILL
jgi:hypothetical protein